MEIITLTLSPAYDVHAYAESFEAGKENLVRIASRDIGGKGINISRALAEYGIDSLAVVLLGQENCEEFEKALARTGLSAHTLKTDGRIRENITIHSKNEETRISFSGFDADTEAFFKVIESISVKSGDILTVTGRIPHGIDIAELKSILISLRKLGAKIVIDSKSFTLDDITDISPWLIKPNAEEISNYLGRRISGLDEALKAAREISSSGIENVIISLGKEGAVLYSSGEGSAVTAPVIDAVSTIGAGDSMIAGFICSYILGEDKSKALKRAVAFGSAACLTEGTSPPSKNDIDKILDNLK